MKVNNNSSSSHHLPSSSNDPIETIKNVTNLLVGKTTLGGLGVEMRW